MKYGILNIKVVSYWLWNNSHWLIAFLVFTVYFSSCSKEKADVIHDNSPAVLEMSSVRLVNLGQYQQVAVNGDTLTNSKNNSVPTKYFTENGLLNKVWNVPKDIFDENGKADMLLYSSSNRIDFSIQDIGDRPIDYYTMYPIGSGQAWTVPIERDEKPSSKQDHFKIRIVNLMKTLPGLSVAGYTGALENLTGAVTLAYSDGSPVSTETTNVSIAQQSSEYIELPYGTYQFKVLAANGRQISATVHGVNEGRRMFDPPTSIMIVPGTTGPGRLTYAPIETFQPGGIYTLVVAPFTFNYPVPPLATTTSSWYQNQFMIVEDVVPPANHSFARVQCINAVGEGNATFRVNGRPFAGAVPSGRSTDYTVVPAETSCVVEAVMGTGVVVARTEITPQAAQNVSFWLWEQSNGEKALLPVYNDLSTNFYVDRFADNGEVNQYEYTMFMASRYLNLCPDIPYASITVNNGQDMRGYSVLIGVNAGHYIIHPDAATFNLQPGIAETTFPYVRWRTDYSVLFEWMVYRSTPEVTPGKWADDIPIFYSDNLVANPQLYTAVGRGVPTFEPGIYTLAIIGRTGQGISEVKKARIIAVKHNR